MGQFTRGNRTAAEDELWTPFNVIRNAYNFQAPESSAFIQVSMLLAAAYGPMGLIIELDVALNLSIEVAHMQLTAWWQNTRWRKIAIPVVVWKSLLVY